MMESCESDFLLSLMTLTQAQNHIYLGREFGKELFYSISYFILCSYFHLLLP